MSHAAELSNIRTILGNFKVPDFKKHVILCFPSELQERAGRIKKKSTKKVIVNEFIKFIKSETIQTLQRIYLRLCTVCVSLHSERKNWHAYEMKNPFDREFNEQRLHGKLLQGCRLNDVDCDIDIVKSKDIVWFTLIQKIIKKNKGLVRSKPVFCAHILGTPFLFRNGVLHPKIGEAFLHAFSFRSIRDLTLIGHDIKSLHKILIRKEGRVASLTVPNYKIKKPRIVFGSRDYTQHENRKDFAQKCFPADAKIETLSLTDGSGAWKGDLDDEDTELRWAVKVLSPNIHSFFQRLCENGLIEPEHAAAYALRLGKEGKNKIQVPIIPDV